MTPPRPKRAVPAGQIVALGCALGVVILRFACSDPVNPLVGDALPPQLPALAPDHSLPLDRYLAAGVPSPDHRWSAEEYAAATKALKELGAGDPTRLPRAGSPSSGALFARIAAADNVPDAAGDDATATRIFALVSYLQSVMALRGLYQRPAGARDTFEPEEVALTGLMLRVGTRVAMLLEEAKAAEAALPAEERRADAALASVGDNATKMFSGVLTLLGLRQGYRSASRVVLADALIDTLPKCLGAMAPDARAEARRHIQRILAAESDGAVRAKVERLLLAVDQALDGLKK